MEYCKEKCYNSEKIQLKYCKVIFLGYLSSYKKQNTITIQILIFKIIDLPKHIFICRSTYIYINILPYIFSKQCIKNLKIKLKM